MVCLSAISNARTRLRNGYDILCCGVPGDYSTCVVKRSGEWSGGDIYYRVVLPRDFLQ